MRDELVHDPIILAAGRTVVFVLDCSMTGPNAPGFGRLLGPLPIPRSSLLTARYVYFSFHYGRDIRRVQHVKNHWVPKRNYRAAGYFDGSLEEKAKK